MGLLGGVSFQPGSLEQRREDQIARKGNSEGVQEAIKVLSLRLPKVVGAQAAAPQALLSSPGAAGNPDVDSMVERVLSRVFPSRNQPTPAAPMLPAGDGAGTFTPSPSGPQRQSESIDRYRPLQPPPQAPRVILGSEPPPTEAPEVGGPPPRYPNQATPDGGFPGGYGNMIEPLPDLRRNFDWLPDVGGSTPSI